MTRHDLKHFSLTRRDKKLSVQQKLKVVNSVFSHGVKDNSTIWQAVIKGYGGALRSTGDASTASRKYTGLLHFREMSAYLERVSG